MLIDTPSTAKIRLTPQKTIQVGYMIKQSLIRELCEKTHVHESTVSLIKTKGFRIVDEPSTIDLVFLTPRYLGFKDSPYTSDFMTETFCTKWSKENLDGQILQLCEAEDAAQLGIQYPEQPKGSILFAMDLIRNPTDWELFLFVLVKDDDEKQCFLRGWIFKHRRIGIDQSVAFRLSNLP